MFQDDASQQAVYWESSWKTIRAQSSAAVQTSEVLTNEAETQSRHLVDSAVRQHHRPSHSSHWCDVLFVVSV